MHKTLSKMSSNINKTCISSFTKARGHKLCRWQVSSKDCNFIKLFSCPKIWASPNSCVKLRKQIVNYPDYNFFCSMHVHCYPKIVIHMSRSIELVMVFLIIPDSKIIELVAMGSLVP